MVVLYRMLSYGLGPLVWLWLRRRMRKGKEDPARIRERFGHAGRTRPEGTLIWVHAASVGESNAVLPLIQKLLTRNPSWQVLVTTGTVTSAATLSARLPERAFHQFVPVDTPQAVKRFLQHWKPDVAVWVESELWPNLIGMTHARGIPMALVNARMSHKSFASWQRHRAMLHQLLKGFDQLFSGSDEDAQKYHALGITHMQTLNNLKYDAPLLPADDQALSDLQTQIQQRRIWLAASTHEGEETQIATAHQTIRKAFDDALTIIVPRHAVRGNTIAITLREAGLKVSQRSKGESIHPETDIYLADTMGELGLFFRLVPLTLIGGSLIPHGGHNPIEAAQLQCAIICGPSMDNFRDIAHALHEAGALLQLDAPEQLADTVTTLMRDTVQQHSMAKAAMQAVQHKAGAVDTLATAIESMQQQGAKG